MASYHVLAGDEAGNRFSVAYHFDIPGSGNNRAGVQWRAALIASGIGGSTILADGDGSGGTISAAEKAAVQSGAVLEMVEQFDTHPGETALQLRARLDARHAALATATLAKLQARLTYFGYVRTL